MLTNIKNKFSTTLASIRYKHAHATVTVDSTVLKFSGCMYQRLLPRISVSGPTQVRKLQNVLCSFAGTDVCVHLLHMQISTAHRATS
jgi:uncharacterized heparinase superfamily protein